MLKNPLRLYREIRDTYKNRHNVATELCNLALELSSKDKYLDDLNKKLENAKENLHQVTANKNQAVSVAVSKMAEEHALYKKSVAEQESGLMQKLEDAKSQCHQHKQELNECEGRIFHLQKALGVQKEQHDVGLTALQQEIFRDRKEKKELALRCERLQQLLDDMALYLMDPKDIEGRLFSKIAPLIDEEGYKLLKEGKGRLKAKIIEPGRKSRVVYLEKAD